MKGKDNKSYSINERKVRNAVTAYWVNEKILILFSCLIPLFIFSQPAYPSYPQNYFRTPLLIPVSLAGNFGDLRNNHYHMGLDFRTGGQENATVIAAADGYVSHIRIEPYGYGRAIFITHPNGLTTLYGHLNAFYPELEKATRQKQYATQSWRQDIDFLPGQFPVRKGQMVAWSGNTGSSEGPHLHFEIRDSGLAAGRNHNPLLFGLGIADGIPPVLYRVGIFNRNVSIYESSPNVYRLQKKKSKGEVFYAPADTLLKVPYGKFSFGLGMEDKTDQSFMFGVYKSCLYVDSVLQCRFVMDKCRYEESRYINAGIDYYTKLNGGSYMQHLSRLPGNHAPFFNTAAGDGLIELLDDSIHIVEVVVNDVAGNESQLRFKIRRDSSIYFRPNVSGPVVQKLLPGRTEIFQNNQVKMLLGETALYDTISLQYRSFSAISPAMSAVQVIGDYRLPVHDSFTLSIKPIAPLPDSIRNKTVMVMTSSFKSNAQRCIWNDGWAEAKWNNFGFFNLKYDDVKPTLRPVNVYDSATFVKDQRLVFDAYDETGDLPSFNGYIDGQWILFRQKNDRYTYDFDDRCLLGWHNLEVRAKDIAGNETVYSCSFYNGRNN